ncbi:MAG: TetR/AcrR family transcriptional regulator [Nocardioidaceae bacterium]
MASSGDDRDQHRPGPRLRADARRNYAAILEAARDLFVERGAGAPLEEVARRAGVGIGTLYRRFPDRDALLREVVLEALARSYASAERARTSAEDGLGGLERYMRDALDLRISAIIPLALDRIDMDAPEVAAAREASASSVERLIAAAHEDGSRPETVTFADIGTLLVRLSRPLPGSVPADLDSELAHRHLDLVLAGLRSAGPDLFDRAGDDV